MELPLVLAGPILRRTENDSVTVWVALKESSDVTLNVYMESAGTSTPLLAGSRKTVKLGVNLHVVSVTAKPIGTDSGTDRLQPGNIYSYDLKFDNGKSLASSDVIGDIKKITYGTYNLPTFVMPPADFKSLRIIHGSCRKPHDTGNDALTILDDIIKEAVAQPNGIRPHLLFMTGDQIYADDVSSSLLHCLTEMGDELLYGQQPGQLCELLPGINKRPADIKPGTRKEVVRTHANFTSDDSENHLLSFSEYCAMYLFVWSDVVWPRELPEFKVIFPNEFKEWGEDNSTILKNLLPRHRALIEKFEDDIKQIKNFKTNLWKVRRALANIPVYMMFDDHEITDDWYLHAQWVNDVLNTSLGPRIIQNGLLAFALFQAWGNTPDRFMTGTNGDKLLNAVEAWDRTEIKKRLGIPVKLSTNPLHLPVSADSVRWHYTVEGPDFQAIVLDTRTMRSYPSKIDKGPSALINPQRINEQLQWSQLEKEIYFIIAPAPFLGVPWIEEIVLKFAILARQESFLDAEAWSLNEDGFQRFLTAVCEKKRVVVLSGDVHYGFTQHGFYWGDNPYPSGDARRSVCIQLTASPFKNEDNPASETLHKLGNEGYIAKRVFAGWLTEQPGGIHVGVGTHICIDIEGCAISSTTSIPIGLNKNPAFVRVDNLPPYSEIIKPDWMYRIVFLKDERLAERSFSLLPWVKKPIRVESPHAGDRKQELSDHLNAQKNHGGYLGKWGNGKTFVGKSNLGDISFKKGEEILIHELWWWLPEAPKAFPLTRYEVPLAQPPDPMPWNLINTGGVIP